jgi:hypothetical protein
MTGESSSPPPGWYPDPAGTPRRRYWDGRAWTEFFADGAAGAAGGAVQQPRLPEGTKVDTVFIWVLVLLPLLSLIAFLFWDLDGYLRRQIEDPRGAAVAQFADPGYLLFQAVGWLAYAATVVLAVLDWRALKRLGVVRPFHWAWAFLPIVYVIGRAVVLRNRVHAGLAPLWTYIAVYVVVIVVIVAKAIATAVAIAPLLPSGSGGTGT